MSKIVLMQTIIADLEGRRVSCSKLLFPLVNRTLNAYGKYACVEKADAMIEFTVLDSTVAKAGR